MAKEPTIPTDGVDFARYNMERAKEGEEHTAKATDKNFDYNAKKNLKR